jgi:dTMP kinase
MKFAVIEGLDGSGKSTQIKLLKEYLDKNKTRYKYLHFPRTDAPVYGELVAMFLRGELGEISQVNPYLIALIYAGDRMDAAGMINEWLDQDYLVLVDRYVISNIAFQCAKLDGLQEREALQQWILHLEYSHNKIPVPDLNLFLDVPFEFTTSQLTSNREGTDRDYLKGNRDIHEENLQFQSRVREVYRSLENKVPGYKILNCTDTSGRMLQPSEVFEKIRTTLQM